MAIDLHVHSRASDGTTLPGDIPALAAFAGLSAVALTDHDTTAGLPAFMARQGDYPEVKLVPGIELSSRFGGREIHLTGLFINPDDYVLQEFVAYMQNERLRRADALFERLAALGYPLTPAELRAAGASATVPGRPHFARAMVTKYGFPDNAAVFDRLLKRGAPGYVPRQLPEPEQAIEAIKHAGGAAIWAHPVAARGGEGGFARRLIQRLKPAGLDGMEAYYSDFLPSQTVMVQRLAEEYHLILSGGSDYHGDNHPDVKIGIGHGNLHVPDALLEAIEHAIAPKIVIL